MYTVYVHVFPNGKRYVGTTTSVKQRWGANGGQYRNEYMMKAIKEFGWENIKHEIVATDLPKEQAETMEMELIHKYRSYERDFGYNISPGGIDGKIMSDETKAKLRKANLGKVMSEESRKKITEALKKRVYTDEMRKHMSDAQKKSFANGNRAIHSPEARAKAKASLKGRKFSEHTIQLINESKYHPVQNLVTGIMYPSIKEASEKTGVSRSTIMRNCQNKTKKRWQYIDKSEYKKFYKKLNGIIE